MREQGLTEVSCEDRFLFKGPYAGQAGAGYVVFRTEFRDAAGATRRGFCRCGNHARGLLGRHDLDVRWDD